ncbi:MAG: NusG domain II-containing protein [Anaerovoracaceae bacterium]
MSFFKKSDVVIIAVILLVSLAFWLVYDSVSNDRSVKAEIYYYDRLAETISLDGSEESTFSISQNPNVIFRVDEDGNIAFIASDCPDKVCVNTGKIHRVGEYAACLPNGIILKIVPEGDRDDDDVDIIL